jgi:NAD(P)-dependent dehydrogenase (short-subunit alcohol dehydrogenase family)
MTDAFSLEGKTILVTGSSSGIGRAVAKALAREGAKVFVTGRNPERVAETLAEMEGSGHISLVADLTIPDELKSLVAATPVLDGLVLNAGVIPKLIPFNSVDSRHLAEVMNINFTAPAELLNQLLRAKKLANDSSIVIVNSTAAFLGPSATAVYSAAKAALAALSRSVALDVHRRRIRSNCVAYGYVKTDLTMNTVPEKMLELVPLGPPNPDEVEVTGPILFLLSGASRWITRTMIIVDGGISLKISLGM